MMGPTYRADLLEKMGEDVPETIEELHDLLVKCKENGMGAPMTLESDGGTTLSWAWGVNTDWSSNYWQYDKETATVMLAPFAEGWDGWLDTMRDWYAEGLIDKNFTAGSPVISGDYSSFENDQTLFYGFWFSWLMGDELYKQGFVSNENLDLQPLAGFVLNEGDEPIKCSSDSCIGQEMFVTTQALDRIETVAKWLDYNYTEEGVDFRYYGIEGESYTVDENGNWSDDPDFAPFPAEGTARIVEYAAESTSSGKALLAYIMDLDGDVSTTGDREVFLSVYDFREGSVLYPPVMVTSGLVEEDAQNLAFTKFELVEGEKTYLTYLSQGELKLVDMACLDSENAVLTGKVEGVTFSYLNKNPEAAAYQEESFFAGTAAQEWKIEDYTTFSTTDGFYVLFTEQGDPANLWAVRYDSGENTVEGPVLLDDAYGAGYDEMAVALDTITGTLAALAVTEASGTARLDALTWSLEKTIANKLVRLENEGIEEPSASGTDAVDAGFEIYNNSFAPIEGITLFITDGNGDSIQAAVELTDGQGNPAPATEPFTLGVGQKATVTFQLPVGSDATKVSFTAQLQASDGTDLGTLQYELPISAEEPDPSPTPPYIPPQPTGPSTAGSDGWEDILDELQGVQSGGAASPSI